MTASPQDERRSFHRILFDAPATLASAGKCVEISLLDLSLSGALLQTPDGWTGTVGGEASLDVRLSEESHIIMQAEIAHLGPEKLGLRCRHIDMESISHLRRLVELNLGDSALLERELEALG